VDNDFFNSIDCLLTLAPKGKRTVDFHIDMIAGRWCLFIACRTIYKMIAVPLSARVPCDRGADRELHLFALRSGHVATSLGGDCPTRGWSSAWSKSKSRLGGGSVGFNPLRSASPILVRIAR